MASMEPEITNQATEHDGSGTSQPASLVPTEPGTTSQGIERAATPRQTEENALVSVSSALFTDGHPHTNSKKSKAPRSRQKKTPTSNIGLLSPKKSNRNIANLLQQARLDYWADDFKRKIVNWYATVFRSENVERIKEKIKATQEGAPPILLPPPDLPKRIGTVTRDVYKILEWPVADEFRQFHQLLAYARLARHWTKLVNHSREPGSTESQYMRAMAKTQDITKKQTGEALVSGFMVWTLYGIDQRIVRPSRASGER